MPTATDIGRSAFIFTFVASIVDTALVALFTASGMKVPTWAAFAPPQLVNWVQSLAQQTTSMQSNVTYAFFMFLLFPTVFLAIVNFIIGVFAGLPMLAFNVAYALGVFAAAPGAAAALIVLAAIPQAFAVFYVVETLLALATP